MLFYFVDRPVLPSSLPISRPSQSPSPSQLSDVIPPVYENVRQKNMPEWVDIIDDLQKDHNLESLAVYSINLQSYAHTIGFQVTDEEITQIDECLSKANEPNIYDNIQITVANNTYSIVPNEYSEEHMQCMGPINFENRYVWISKSSMYIVIGICPKEHEKDCLNAVYDLIDYIKKVEI